MFPVILTGDRFLLLAIPSLVPRPHTPFLLPARYRVVCSTCNFQVNLAVYGHHHSYQRTCLVANEVCLGVSSRAPTNNEEYRAPVHVVVGTAGMGLVSENHARHKECGVRNSSPHEGKMTEPSGKIGVRILVTHNRKIGGSFRRRGFRTRPRTDKYLFDKALAPPHYFYFPRVYVLPHPQSKNMVSPRPQWVEYASDREFGLGMIVADSNKLRLSFILDSDSQVCVRAFVLFFDNSERWAPRDAVHTVHVLTGRLRAASPTSA